MPPSNPSSGPPAHQDGAVLPLGPEYDAAAQRLFGLLGSPRIELRTAGRERGAVAPPRAFRTAWPARRAQRRPQVHHRLREVARPPLGGQRARELLDLPARPRQRLLDRVQPRDDAQHVAVDGRRPLAEGDRRDRRGGIGADARQRAKRRFVFREATVMVGGDDPRAGMQVARPRVVAEALPSVQDGVEVGGGEILDARPARDEGIEVGRHRGGGGLLQHDLAQPHPVRVGGHARWSAPGQVPPLPVVPGEQRSGEVVRGIRHERDGRWGSRHTLHTSAVRVRQRIIQITRRLAFAPRSARQAECEPGTRHAKHEVFTPRWLRAGASTTRSWSPRQSPESPMRLRRRRSAWQRPLRVAMSSPGCENSPAARRGSGIE